MTNFKKKPASLIGAPIKKQECQQLKSAFKERFPDQVPSVFLNREVILKSIEGLSNLSGIHFVYGLDDADVTSSRRIILAPTHNISNGESGIVQPISPNGYLCDNGERIDFEKLLVLLGNHVTNFKSAESEFVLSRLPRGYFWGINKISKLLEVEKGAGLVLHFGFNADMPTPCRQYQNVLEVVDANRESLNVFMEYGQCNPPCNPPCDPKDPTNDCSCFISVAAERSLKDADKKLDLVRAFRDNWLLKQENGKSLYEMYYFLSPGIVAEIIHQPDQDTIWKGLSNEFSKCLDLIKQNKHEEAKAFYINIMHNLAERFLVQQVKTEVLI